MDRGVMRIPGRAANRIGAGRAEGEFHRLGLAEDDGPGPAQAGDERAFAGREIRHVDLRSGRRRHPADGKEILHGDRYPHERPEVDAGTQQRIERAGGLQGAVAVDVFVGVELPVEARNPLQIPEHLVLDGDRARPNPRSERGKAGTGHGIGRDRRCRHEGIASTVKADLRFPRPCG
jgi:hypothetical protein